MPYKVILKVRGFTAVSAPKRRDRIPGGGVVWVFTPTFQVTAAFYDDIAGNLGNVEGAGGHKLTSYAIAEYFLSKRTELYAEVDRNGFSGAYRYDPANIAALGRSDLRRNSDSGRTSNRGLYRIGWPDATRLRQDHSQEVGQQRPYDSFGVNQTVSVLCRTRPSCRSGSGQRNRRHLR